jgi:subfamily B ATP-binding cassette protein MsbA
MKKFFHLLRYGKPYLRLAYLNVLFNFLSIVFGLFSFGMLMPFLRFLFGMENIQRNTDAKGFTAFYNNAMYELSNIIGTDKAFGLLIIVLAVFILTLIKNVCRYLALYYLVPFRNNTIRDLRNAIYKKVMRLQLSFYSDEKKGDIMSKMSNDLTELEMAIMTSLESLFKEPFTILIYLIALILMSPYLTLIILILLPLSALIISNIGKRLKEFAQKSQGRLGQLMSLFEETLNGLRVIKGFGREGYFFKRFMRENDLLNRINIAVNRTRDLGSPISETLGVLVLAVVLYSGGLLVIKGTSSLEPEMFITYLALFSQIISPAKAFSSAFYSVQKGAASAERIEELLHASEMIHEKENAIRLQDFKKEIVFSGVSFSYLKGKHVLEDISFSVKRGKTVALVGPSGSGKSTIADLLARFYDVQSGSIALDGINLKDYKVADLRKVMGLVTQESILFNDTVFNNIAFGNQEVTFDQVAEAARVANAHEFIEKMERGYYTNIGDKGNKLSGGQKQRIAIARAVLHDPQILILDEATSALDTTSERLVQEAINNLMQHRTSLVIAHRLSTIMNADLILVLQQGKIVQQGNHQTLSTEAGLYKSLLEMQALS